MFEAEFKRTLSLADLQRLRDVVEVAGEGEGRVVRLVVQETEFEGTVESSHCPQHWPAGRQHQLGVKPSTEFSSTERIIPKIWN